MIPVFEFFRSVELVWAIWLISSALFTLLVRQVVKRWRPADLWNLVKCEDGSTYTVSYVIAFPFFALLVAGVVQSTIILVVKMGTVYASYGSARSAIVWLEADPQGGKQQTRRDRIEQAAVNAMTPFGSSSRIHAQWLGISDSAWGDLDRYFFYQAYQKYSSGPAPKEYIYRKYQCAKKQTEVKFEPATPVENEPVTLTLTYQMPLHIPWFAKLLGRSNGIVPLQTKVILPFEGSRRMSPRREISGHELGIPYNSP